MLLNNSLFNQLTSKNLDSGFIKSGLKKKSKKVSKKSNKKKSKKSNKKNIKGGEIKNNSVSLAVLKELNTNNASLNEDCPCNGLTDEMKGGKVKKSSRKSVKK